MVGVFWQNRGLIWQMTKREVLGRYKGSAMGVVWTILTPLLMLTIYTFVFSVVFKARWRVESEFNRIEFALTLFAGLIAFNVFAEVMHRAPNLILANRNYVKKVVFPLEILPVCAVGAALFHCLMSVVILVLGQALIMGKLSTGIVLLPLAAIPLAGFSLGLGWFLSSLGVYLRDIAHAIGLTVQMLFFLTPIFYPLDAVPLRVRAILRLNPLTEIVDSFRRALVWDQPLDWSAWAIVTVASAVVLVTGYVWFMRTRPGFADVI